MAVASAEADADAYTVEQVARGLTRGGVITGVDFGHGVVSGVGAIGNRPVYTATPAGHVATPAVFSGVFEAKADPVPEADPLVYTTRVHAPVGASTFAHGVVVPAVSSVVTPVPRTIIITSIIKIIKIIKGLAACGNEYGEVYEECVEYGDNYGNYEECQEYVNCVATSTLV